LLVSDTGRETEPERAAELWRQGCEGGRTAACINWAVCLETGLGTDFDGVKGREILTRTCDEGHIEGCLQLAVSLENRPGETDATGSLREALRLYRRVCAASGGPAARDNRACKGQERLEKVVPKRGVLDSL
jgi:TPR repeat protein